MKKLYVVLLALFSFSMAYAQCTYVLELNDAFGDGWGGGSQITVTIAGGTPTVYTVPNPPGNQNVINLPVNDGDSISLDYIADATTPGDNSYILRDSEGITVFDSGFAPASLMNSFTASCPTCPAVTSITSNNVQANTADISWTAGGTETAWIIEYGISPYTCGSGGTQVPVTTNPATISNLNSETTYDVYVIADCGMGDLSACQGPITFTTTESCPAPSNFAPVTNTANSVSFTWDANGNPNSTFNVEYAPQGVITMPGTGQGSVEQQFTAPFAIVSNLSSDTDYEFYIQIDCGMGDLSTWAGPYSATTLISCPEITAFAETQITSDQIDVSWTAGSTETEWEIEYATVGTITNPGTGQGTSSNVMTTPAFSATMLTDATIYEFFVRAVCDNVAPDYSRWSGPFAFTTDCLVFTPTSAAPYMEGFENFTVTASFTEELCWSTPQTTGFTWDVSTGGTTSSSTGPNSAANGSNYIYTEASSGQNGDEATMVGPQFDLSGLTNPSVQFNYHMHGDTIGDLNVEVDDGSGFTAVATISGQQQANQGDSWLLQIVNLAAYANQTISIQFRASRGSSFTGDIAIDDVFVGELPACADPNMLTVGNLSDVSAELGWSENGLASAWDIEVGAPGFAVDTGAALQVIAASSNPESVSGLTAETDFEFYVRSNCGVDGTSAWVGPFAFTTLCSPEVAPYTQDFDMFATGAFSSSNCWEASTDSTAFTAWEWLVRTGTTPTANTGPSGAHSGNNYVAIEGNGGAQGNEAVLLSPLVDISGLTSPALQFYTHMFGSDTGILHVDINDGSGFTNDVMVITGEQQGTEAAPFDLQLVDLSSYSGTVQVRFRAERTHTSFTGLSDIAIDTVIFDEMPACPQPSQLAVGTLTDTTADLSWNENGSATAWSIEYGPCGFTPGDGTSTTVPAPTNPFTLTGLTAFTCYDFYVTADCGMGTMSSAAGPNTFTTECASFTAPFFDNFEAFTASTNFVEENCFAATSDSAYDWNVEDSGSTPSSGTGPTGAFSGNKYFYTEASNGASGDEASLTSPLIDISALTTPSVQFKFHMFGGNMGTLNVDVNDGTGWQLAVDQIMGQQQTAQGDDWLDRVVDLQPLTLASNVIQVRLRAVSAGSFQGDISIDDFRVDDIPTCPNVTALTSSNPSQDSIDISWTAGGTETEWVVEYREVGSMTFTAVTPNVTTNPYTLTGLNSGTEYEICVSAVCNAATNDISQQVCTIAVTQPDFCAGDPFLDSGGATGDYQPNENVTFNICPENAGDVVYVSFTLHDTEDNGNNACFDGLTIHDGPDATFPTIDTASGSTEWCWDPSSSSGTGNLVGQLLIGTTSSGCLTFVFESDGSVQRSGWSANVTCAPPPTCDAPSGLAFVSATDTTANLSWTAGGNETEWDVVVGPVGFDQDDASTYAIPLVNVTGGTPATTVSGLTSNTTYEYYVRAVCAPGDVSLFIGPFSFTTECSTFTAPYFNGFENMATTLDFDIDDCWSATATTGYDWNIDDAGSTPSGGTGPSGPRTGSKYFYTEASGAGTGDTATLVSPVIDLSGLTAPSVEFYYHMFGGEIGTLELEIFDGTNWVNLATLGPGQIQTADNDPWLLQLTNLSAYANQTVQFRFIATSAGSFQGDISIDDFKVDEMPACPDPNMLTVANITDTSADLSWTEVGNATSWSVEYGPCGFTPGAGNGTVVTANTNTNFAISNLASNTCFEYYVTSDCGMGTLSGAAGPFSFSTLCSAFTSPYSEDFESFTISVSFTDENCWSSPQTSGYTWDVSTGTTPSNPTGPTSGANGSGRYFFTEASGGVAGDEAELLSPRIDLSGVANPALEFAYHMFGATIGVLHVDVNDGSGWTADVATISGQQQTADTDPWLTSTVGLNAFANATIQIRFRGERGSSFTGDIAIDDVEVIDFTGCLPPTNLDVTNITATGADLSWTAGGSETAWEYAVVATGSGTPTAAGTSTMNTSETVSMLTAATTFDAYVRADCGMGNLSDWIGPFTFTTLCAPLTAPYGTYSAMGSTPGNDFATFPGNCWEEGDNTTVAAGPNGTDGAWSSDEFANDAASAFGDAARINIFNTAAINDWLVTPDFDLGTGTAYSAIFNIAHVDFSTSTPDTFDGDQAVQFLISDDNGATWTVLQTWDATTPAVTIGEEVIVDLSAYSGMVRMAFWGTNGINGTVTGNKDTDFFVDSFVVDATNSTGSVQELGFNYYPNPTTDFLNIEGEQSIDTITVSNMLGQEVMTMTAGSTTARVDLTTLSTGVYLVKVATGDKVSTVRVVKE